MPESRPTPAVAEQWLAAEPDTDMRNELQLLLDGPSDELAARFSGRLQFGTAGLRGAVGAGPQRMNRLVVRQAAAGLVDHLLATVPDAAERGVIIGYDARRKSDVFALDTARVCAARGVRAMLFPHVVPTPVLAWNIVGTNAAAGVMVTASHNPPADNGYKVYLGSGAQIVPPADEQIAARIDAVDPCTVELSTKDHPLIDVLGGELEVAYLASVPACPLPSGGVGHSGGLHRVARSGRCHTRRCVRARLVTLLRSWSPSSNTPTARSQRSASRTRRNQARWIG